MQAADLIEACCPPSICEKILKLLTFKTTAIEIITDEIQMLANTVISEENQDPRIGKFCNNLINKVLWIFSIFFSTTKNLQGIDLFEGVATFVFRLLRLIFITFKMVNKFSADSNNPINRRTIIIDTLQCYKIAIDYFHSLAQ